jgi:hypothetical protein
MATAAQFQPTEECTELRAIRARYAINPEVCSEEIFYCSRIGYHGSHRARESARQEHEDFLATGKLPYHLIRCSHRDVVYPRAWMNPS